VNVLNSFAEDMMAVEQLEIVCDLIEYSNEIVINE
tara:strand:+ start:375 stop:479 length:105 start_codon:yes stop_codon:yes gene_type:complete